VVRCKRRIWCAMANRERGDAAILILINFSYIIRYHRLGNITHSFGDIGSNQKIIIAVLPHNNSSLRSVLSLSLAIISICLSVCCSPDSLNVFFLRSIPTRFNFFCTQKSL
jgi:hypothetical protein